MTSIIQPKNLQGWYVNLREVTLDDAEFILKLRTNPKKNAYLHPTENNLEKQKKYLEHYLTLENELYFIIENKQSEPLGTIRIYDIEGETFTSGSWLMRDEATREEVIEGELLCKQYAFEVLNMKIMKFDVRRKNKKVLRFHNLWGAQKIDENDLDIFFEFTRQDYFDKKNYFKELIKPKPLVSVIIAYYNGAKYIEETIKSVYDQTYKNFELIIVDDASPNIADSEFIKKMQKKYNFILIRHSKNMGASQAISTALEHIKGEYVVSVGHDDIMMPDKIEYSVSQMLEHDYDMLTCSGITISSDGTQTVSYDEKYTKWLESLSSNQFEDRLQSIDDMRMYAIQGSIYKSNVFAELHSQCSMLKQDDWPLALLAWKNYKCKFSSKPVYYYRVTQSSASRGSSFANLAIECETISKLFPEDKKFEIFAWCILNTVHRMILRKENTTLANRLLAAGKALATSEENLQYANRLSKDLNPHQKIYGIRKLYYKLWKHCNKKMQHIAAFKIIPPEFITLKNKILFWVWKKTSKFLYKKEMIDNQQNLKQKLELALYNQVDHIDLPHFNFLQKKLACMLANKNNITNLALRGSHCRFALNPKYLSQMTFNFGLNSQDLFGTYYFYKNYVSQLPQLKNVIVSYAIYLGGYELQKSSEKYYSAYYKYLFDIPYNIHFKNKILKRIKKMSLPEIKASYMGYDAPNYKLKTMTSERVTRHLKHFHRNKSQLKYLRMLQELCDKNGHNLIILVPPYRDDYCRELPAKDLEEMLNDIKSIVPEENIYSFFGNSNFSQDDFNDTDHLSEKGAEKLSKMLDSILVKNYSK